MSDRPRVAIVHDYVTQRGGAERVVLTMLRCFPGAELHTSLYEPTRTFPEFGQYRVRTLRLNHIAPLRAHHRAAFPVLATAFGHYQVDADIVLCSSSGWAHGVRTSGRKVVYCYTPARWLYQTDRYVGQRGRGIRSRLMTAAIGAMRRPLEKWDQQAARSAERYIVMSRAVQSRVLSIYGLNAPILPPPPADLTAIEPDPLLGLDSGFLLCVSRLLPYKNVDVVLDSMRALPTLRLVVVGDGPEESRLRAKAPPNAHLLGSVSDARLAWLYRNCSAIIAASHEDFGLVPIEAALFGRPTAALAWGGYLDTIVDGRTGVLFEEPTTDHVVNAIRAVLELRPALQVILDHSRQFQEDQFCSRLRDLVDD